MSFVFPNFFVGIVELGAVAQLCTASTTPGIRAAFVQEFEAKYPRVKA